MNDNIKKLQAFLAELNASRDAYISEAQPEIVKHYRGQRKGRPPRVFNDTSFLYIRSYDGDAGLRPFSGITFWNSPDIQLHPVTDPATFTTSLQAGSIYNIRCQLHNTGDVTVPYPKLEYFLCDPTLGFDTRFARYLGVTHYKGLLLSGAHDFVDFSYQVPPSEAGHKCLFARTYSFSPLDQPLDVYDLNPRIDRHIGQKNLNIVGQAENYQFNIIHQPNMQERIDFLPLTQQAVAMLGIPMMHTMRIRGQQKESMFRKAKLELADRKNGLEIGWDRIGLKLSASGDGPGIKTQATIGKRVEAAVSAIGQSKASRASFKEVFKAFRDMNRHQVQSTVNMRIPDMGLAKGEVAGFEMVNTNLVTGQVKGGITLIVQG